VQDLRSYGIGTSFIDLARVWWLLAFDQGRFTGPEDLSSLAWVVPLPLLAILSWPDLRSRKYALVCLVYAVFWFFTSQSLRYLLPILPIVCALTASLLSRTARALARQRTRVKRSESPGVASLGWGTILVAVLLMIPAPWFAVQRLASRGAIPATEAERDRYLSARLASYPFYAAMNRRHGRTYGVYALYDSRMAYFADGRFVGDWFGPARHARIEAVLDDPERLERELTRLGAGYLVVDLTDPRGRHPDPERLRGRIELLGMTEKSMWLRITPRNPRAGGTHSASREPSTATLPGERSP
jgi:hypothetical protein